MMRRRVGAFTLIELLVVIAIIGILAAMVFPVFARARESARRAVCLSNVKNIALAVQMYLADNNDTLPPIESDQRVLAWFDAASPYTDPTYANPYLRWPVVLDEYVKNRGVWRCPSALYEGGADIINPWPDWLGAVMHFLEPGEDLVAGGRTAWWPVGWGGAITNSFEQYYEDWDSMTRDPRAFAMSIGLNAGDANDETWGHWGLRITKIQDPASFIICGDAGVNAGVDDMHLSTAAFPEVCRAACSACNDDCDCPLTGTDIVCQEAAVAKRAFLGSPDRKQSARHFGGNNFGFLDGHAAWWSSDRLIAEFADRAREGDSHPMGLYVCGYTSFWSGANAMDREEWEEFPPTRGIY
jgi:prepilin-type N-terminal cleavage/methylation domain-containing protein/prepilin-type processing-associated H-X9-DG protein